MPKTSVPAKQLTAIQEAKAFARVIIDNPEYRSSVLRRACTGQLPAALEVRILEYMFGRPVDQVALSLPGVSPEQLSSMSEDELLMMMDKMAREIREARKLESMSTDPNRIM